MAVFDGSVNCTNCLENLETWVSKDGGTNYFQIPYNTAQRKVASRATAQQVKLEGTSTNVCSVSSKSWAFQLDFWYCLLYTIEHFLIDGTSYLVRVVNGKFVDTDPYEEFTADYDDNGWDRDVESATPEKRTCIFNATSSIALANFPVLGAGDAIEIDPNT